MTDLTGNIFIEGPAGRLEALLKEAKSSEDPDLPTKRVAIVCHPHPLFGGTMHNKVVYRIAKAFLAANIAVLKFNFRGVGRSEGDHAEGVGEEGDLRAAISFMEERYPDAGIWLAGFSFGAAVMLRTPWEGDRIRAQIAAGTPGRSTPSAIFRRSIDQNSLFKVPWMSMAGLMMLIASSKDSKSRKS